MEKLTYDTEYHSVDEKKREVVVPVETGVIHGESFITGDSTYARIQRLAHRFGVETRGIEPVPEDERTDRNTWKVGTMWCACNMTVATFSIGALAVPVFNLGFVDALLTIIFFNLLGVLPVCFFSTLGPVFGMRQIVLSRFYWGYYGVKVIALLNCLSALGWSAANTIVGAQLLHAVNTDVPGWASVIVIGACTFIVTLFGYKVVHYYEMISWAPCFIIFLIVLGEFAKSGEFYNIPMKAGTSEVGSILSFAASIFGFSTGWAAYAADYTCYQPRNASRTRISLWVFCGLMTPFLFCEILGLAIGTATVNNQAFYDAYTQRSVGGVLAQVLFPPLGNFGKFCLVILALGMVGNNCPNIYSLGFNLQNLTHYAQSVPRFIWTFIGTIIYCAIAIPGYSHFESVLENLMLCIAYWLGIYLGVSLPEHIIFRRGTTGFAPSTYNQPKKLPPSIAAIAAFCFGVLGTVMGMAQVWFVGPIGRKAGGEYGGDVGFELAFAFSFVTYIPFRYLEKKHFGR